MGLPVILCFCLSVIIYLPSEYIVSTGGFIMKKFKIIDLLIFIIATELVGALSALFSGGGFAEYYNTLVKPPIAPPGGVFPIAWAILYTLMGAACYLVYISDREKKHLALKLYLLQLFVNFLWSPVFFGTKNFTAAAVIAVILLITVTAANFFFFKISDTAGALFLPYLLWSAYALYLTIGFLVLNR